MFLFFTFLGIVLLYCLCWNMKETKRFEFSRGDWKRFRLSIRTALEGTSNDGCRELLCEFRCYPTKTGYLDLALCLWIPFVGLSIHWGNWDIPNKEAEL